MAFTVSPSLRSLIEHWWYAVQEALGVLIDRHVPAEGAPAPRLVRVEAQAISSALDIFEALVRRMLVILAAELGPAPAPEGLPRLLFRIDECPPEPVVRQPRAGDPDYGLTASPERAPPLPRQAGDGLVAATRILKRLAALAHVFEHAEAYLAAMRARLTAPLKPLHASLPGAFTEPALTPEQAARIQTLNEAALQAQACDTS